ncbi:hypothetical protein M407DRAFT_9232 [Tulasnella calospora MUT 4182]|uniref:Uncharacterized protein n=1 Tax=Tulasnella calospora MUT 4182 TaxID=1051891 RepID=A0A0C3Q4I7_9AGAM|nr:hypothetical protein M407DRAFT_9232 [Tulasnella calospora MUT 4182]
MTLAVGARTVLVPPSPSLVVVDDDRDEPQRYSQQHSLSSHTCFSVQTEHLWKRRRVRELRDGKKFRALALDRDRGSLNPALEESLKTEGESVTRSNGCFRRIWGQDLELGDANANNDNRWTVGWKDVGPGGSDGTCPIQGSTQLLLGSNSIFASPYARHTLPPQNCTTLKLGLLDCLRWHLVTLGQDAVHVLFDNQERLLVQDCVLFGIFTFCLISDPLNGKE